VAVLPFDDLSGDKQLAYFADGLSEDILNTLVRSSDVRVTAQSSSFGFRGAAKAKAGAALNADYLLDGSVLRDGDRLRVNAHLSDVHTGQTLWSETYDRGVGQTLQIEDEIAARVASALSLRFAASADVAHPIDPAVFELYLKGREASRIHSPESTAHGGDLLRQAVAAAPNFSAAWFELADNYVRRAQLAPLSEQPPLYAQGRQAAQRAFELDPKNGAALAILPLMSSHRGHWSETDAILRRALAISPHDPDVLLMRGAFLIRTHQLRDAVAVMG
jgi:adenylate cyclase